MSDVTEGIGTAIEGALLGGAVERKDGGEGLAAQGEGACLNCGETPLGNYCQNCGQRRHVHRTLSAIGHDLIHAVLHLDGKFWRTLPLLLFKPGTLTRRYIEGERAKFVSPMAMFLFSVFAMFAVFQAVGISAPADFRGGFDVGTTAATLQQQGQAESERLRERIAALPEGDPQRVELEENLATLERVIEGSSAVAEASASDGGGWELNLTGIESIDQGIVKKWNENPGLMLYKMQANAYKFSWLLIPLSVPFVWLIFAWKRRFKAYDHAIFMIAVGIPVAPVVLAMMIIPPFHLYKHLRKTYEIGRFSALWRLLAISLFIWIIILLFVQTLMVIGAF